MTTASMKKSIITKLRIGLCIFTLLVISGCTEFIPSRTTIPAQESQSSDITPSKISMTKNETLTFGIIYPMAHPFYEMITRHAEEAAKSYSVELIVKAPDEANLEQQIRIMETMIKQKVNGIAINPVDATALVPVINKAIHAGIPVICFESDSPDSKRLSFIGTDNIQAGTRLGEVIDDLLNGKGMILVETGMSEMKSQSQRLEGMLGYLNSRTEIQVLEVRYNEGSDAIALDHLETMIDAHPHFDALIALDFVSGSSSVLVWKAMGLNRYVLTFGMMPEIKEALLNGQITSAISQNEHLWGQKILELLLLASQGQPIPAFDDTGTVQIHIDNVENVQF